MTRIDIHPPIALCDQHVLSNHREIKRVCFRLGQRLEKNKFDDLPAPFYTPGKNGKEGKFHELFWLDKGMWTFFRYMRLHMECKKRGFDVENFALNWEIYNKKSDFYKNFKPEQEHYDLLEQRVLSRVQGMDKIRYYGEIISFNNYYKTWKQNKIQK